MLSLIRSNPRAWAKIKRIVLIRDRYECQIQGPGCEGRATQPDHIISIMDGGSDELDNLRAACRHCNIRKGGTSDHGFFRQVGSFLTS